MRRPWVAWLILGLSVMLVVVAGILDRVGDGNFFTVGAFVVLGLPFAGVGALIASRLPGLPIGWLMLGTGSALAVANFTDSVVSFALAGHTTPGAAGWAAALSSISFSAFFLMLFLTLFLLPNGRLPSRRWRVVRFPLLALAATDVMLVLNPGAFSDWTKEGVQNPLGIEALHRPLEAVNQAQIALSFVLLFTSIASVAIRFRGARGAEREQLRWIVTAVLATGAVWAVMMVVNIAAPNGSAANASWGFAFASVGLVPVGIGLAVLRYRLYEIDRVVSKTVLYASLTLVLGAVYVGVVLVGQAVSSTATGGSNLSIAVSTLLVAALFLPVRSRLQRVVDRRFNRRRYDAQRTLEAFGARLRDQIDLGTLEHDLRGVVAETMQPEHTSMWRRERRP